jgi:glycerol kinase
VYGALSQVGKRKRKIRRSWNPQLKCKKLRNTKSNTKEIAKACALAFLLNGYSISGMSFGTTKNHIVRAALESIPYQIKDVVGAMQFDALVPLTSFRINGGISKNKFVMQMIADLQQTAIANSASPNASALGAAFLAGLTTGVYKDIDQLKNCISINKTYDPAVNKEVESSYKQWQLHTLDYKNSGF